MAPGDTAASDWQTLMRVLGIEGRQVENEQWFRPAVESISSWFIRLPMRHQFPATQYADEFPRIVAALDGMYLPGKAMSLIEGIPTEFPNTFDRMLTDSRAGTPAALWLFGSAMGEACLSGCDDARLVELAYHLVRQRDIAREAFLETLAKGLSGPCGERRMGMFHRIVRDVADMPSRYVYDGDRPSFLQAMTDWPEQSELEGAWTYRAFDHYPFHAGMLETLQAVRRFDRRAFLELLEKLNVPPAVESVFFDREIREDFAEILALLTEAPLARDRDGTPWNRNITAAKLLSAALRYVGEVADDLRRDDAIKPEDLPFRRDGAAAPLLTELAGVLAARQDRGLLALTWLCHLIAEDRIWGGKEQQSFHWRPEKAAITALVAEFKGHCIGWGNLGALFPQFFDRDTVALKDMRMEGLGDLGGHRHITGADVLLAGRLLEQKEETASYDKGLGLLLELLIRQDSGLGHYAPPSIQDWRHHVLAQLFSTNPDPALAWNEAWRSLSEQRRRCYHRHGEEHPWGDDPSYFLGCTGLAAVGHLIADEAPSSKILAMWGSIFNAAFSAFLNVSFFRQARWRLLIARLFCALPRISHGANGGEAVIAERLGRVGGDDELFVMCALNAEMNGADLSRLDGELAWRLGEGVFVRMRRYVEWEERPNDRGRESSLLDLSRECLQRHDGT